LLSCGAFASARVRIFAASCRTWTKLVCLSCGLNHHLKAHPLVHDSVVAAKKRFAARTLQEHSFLSMGRTIAGDGFTALGSLPSRNQLRCSLVKITAGRQKTKCGETIAGKP
jgi:hypothetical protein